MKNLKETAERTLEALRASRADSGEAYVIRSTRRKAVVKGSRVESAVESIERSDSLGVSVRLLRNGRCGFSWTSDLSKEGLHEMAERAFDAAALVDMDEDIRFQPAGIAPPPLDLETENFDAMPDEERKRTVLEMADAALSASGLALHAEAHFSDWTSESAIATTEGFYGESRMAGMHGYCEAVVKEGSEKQSAGEMDYARLRRRFDPRAIGSRAAEKALAKLNPKPYPTGRTRVVLAPQETASVLDALEGALCADNILKGKSRFESLGGRAASPLFTLIEDASDEEGPNPCSMDDEGTPARRTVLIRKGELTAFLHDLRTARKMGASPTGSAIRDGFGAPPRITSCQMRLETGILSAPEILREAGNGLYIEELMGLHTVDSISGEFSLGASGRAIRGGELAESVSGIAVAGNLFDLLKNVAAVGSDARFFISGKCAPSLLIEGLTVSGR